MRRNPKHRAGFTLTEAVLVIGIIGLVLAGVWMAARQVYLQNQVTDFTRQIITIAQNFRMTYANQQVSGINGSLSVAQNYANMITETDTDLCAGVPCATSQMLEAGMLPADFIKPPPNNILTGAQAAVYGVPSIYVTTEGYPEWLGFYDCDVYTEWEALQGTIDPTLCSGKLVMELDLNAIPQFVCVYLLMNLINAQIDNLISIATPVTGWGPVTYNIIGGSPTLPSSMDVDTADAACSGTSDVPYDASAGLWIMFTN